MPSDRRTEPPTPRRLRRARREGDHPISRLLVGFGALAFLLVAAPFALDASYRSVSTTLTAALRGEPELLASGLASRVLGLAAPWIGAAAAGALLVGLWQTGAVLSTKPFSFNMARMTPFASSGASFGVRALSFGIALAGAIAMGGAAWLIARRMGSALAASVGDAAAALALATASCQALLGWALAISLLLATADGILQHVRWRDRNRMTREEVQQEQRENEGDPELRLARRRAHRELASSGTAAELARASLLVVGVPRLAVALIYDPASDAAPRVLLQGAGGFAATLEALAVRHGIPIEHDTALARALASVPLEREVPRAHYADIARALARVGRVRPGP